MKRVTDDADFQSLKKIIEKRQNVEKGYPLVFPTTMDFKDRAGNTLLFYAVRADDQDEVKALLAKNKLESPENSLSTSLDVTKPFIEALNKGCFEIAELLYQYLQIHQSLDLKLSKLKSAAGKKWFQEKINAEISRLQISEKNNFSFCNSESAKFFYFVERIPFNPTILRHFAEVGNDSYFNALQKNHTKINSDDFLYLIKCAIENNNIVSVSNLIQGMVQQNLANEQPHAKIDTKLILKKGLYFALLSGKNTIADFLLNQGIDLDGPFDKAGNTIFGKLILEKNVSAIHYLLSKTVPLNQQQNYWQQNILHLCAIAQSEEINALIKKLNFPNEMQIQRDIFGYQPKDYYAQKTKSDISQNILDLNFAFYCVLKYLPCPEVINVGLCNGLSRLFQIYKPNYFYSTLDLIAGWDGTYESLFKPFSSDLPQAQYYRNLDELFHGWLNDLVIFAGYRLNDLIGISLHQDDRVREQQLIDNDQGLIPNPLYETEQRYFLRAEEPYLNISEEQVKELLYYFNKMPPQARLEIKGNGHATAARKIDGMILYYDSFLPNQLQPINSIDDLANIIINTKNKARAEALGKSFDPKKLAIEFLIYVHENEKDEFLKNSSYRLIPKNMLPKSTEEAKNFQSNSPNHFTLLHIAIFGRDIAMFKQLIEDGYCDVNEKDSSNRDVLTLVVENNFKEAIAILLNHPNINFDTFNGSDVLAKLLQDNNQILLQNFLNNPKVIPPADLLTEALFREDDQLINYLLNDKRFKFSKDKIDFQLRVALNATEINQTAVGTLLLQGACLSSGGQNNKINLSNFYELEPFQTSLDLISKSEQKLQSFVQILNKIFNNITNRRDKPEINLSSSILYFLENNDSYKQFSEQELLNILHFFPINKTDEKGSFSIAELYKILALHCLVNGYRQLFSFLQETVNYSKEDQKLILNEALKLKEYDAIRILLNHSCELNYPMNPNLSSNSFFQTQPIFPILYILQNNFPDDILQLFLARDVDLSVRDETGKTARELLVEKSPHFSTLVLSAKNN